MNSAVWADIDSCRASAGEQRFDRRFHLYLIDCTGNVHVRTLPVATKELFPSFFSLLPYQRCEAGVPHPPEAISGMKTITVYNNFYNPVYICIAQIIIIYIQK